MTSHKELVDRIGNRTVDHLGMKTVSRVRVTFDPRIEVADVQVSLSEPSKDSRRRAIRRFIELENEFDDEVSLMLRFTSADKIADAIDTESVDATPAFTR